MELVTKLVLAHVTTVDFMGFPGATGFGEFLVFAELLKVREGPGNAGLVGTGEGNTITDENV